VPRIGFLQAGDPEPSWSLFKKAMADAGYVDGPQHPDRIPQR
jgi:hypothetical protein